MYNFLSDMDLQTRPLKSRCHFLAMTSRTIRVPLRRGSDERSHAIRLKVFSPLLLRQKAPTARNGRNGLPRWSGWSAS